MTIPVRSLSTPVISTLIPVAMTIPVLCRLCSAGRSVHATWGSAECCPLGPACYRAGRCPGHTGPWCRGSLGSLPWWSGAVRASHPNSRHRQVGLWTRKGGNVLFNDALNTFFAHLTQTVAIDRLVCGWGTMQMFYLMTHSTHFSLISPKQLPSTGWSVDEERWKCFI